MPLGYRLTSLLEAIIGDYCVEHNATAIEKLARDVKKISDIYIGTDASCLPDIFAQEQLRRAYLCYYLPVNLVKLFPILEELDGCADRGLLSRDSCAVLDLGCGPGTFMLGFLEYLMQRSQMSGFFPAQLQLWGVDESREALQAAEGLITRYLARCAAPGSRAGQAHFIKGALCSENLYERGLPRDARFDFIIAGNVMTEMHAADALPLLRLLERHLAHRGAFILIDPGTRRASRGLMKLRALMLQETSLHLFAPCLCHGACPLYAERKQWCHEKIFWEPPAIVRAIDAHTGFSKSRGLKFSYFTFLKGDVHSFPVPAGQPRGAVWRVVSYIINRKGEQRLYVCNGLQRLVLRRMNRHASEHNAEFDQARRGDIIIFHDHQVHQQFMGIDQKSTFQILHSLR
jgi:SAM-dependent methyltransferase